MRSVCCLVCFGEQCRDACVEGGFKVFSFDLELAECKTALDISHFSS